MKRALGFYASKKSYLHQNRKNDFVISLRSFQGGIETSFYQGLVSPAYTVFRAKDKDKVNVNYFKFLFKAQKFINLLNNMTYGIRDGKAISYSDFSEIKIDLPCNAEQQKIADYLSTLDLKIEKEKGKFESLKKLQIGFIQKMFI